MDMKPELAPVPVTDVDRAKAIYAEKLGFVVDVDVRPADGVRVVQVTPPGSHCSIALGTGLPALEKQRGSIRALHLVVPDVEHEEHPRRPGDGDRPGGDLGHGPATRGHGAPCAARAGPALTGRVPEDGAGMRPAVEFRGMDRVSRAPIDQRQPREPGARPTPWRAADAA